MAQLEVIVKRLNRRKSPVADFGDIQNVIEVVSKGFVFESVAQIENNLGIWHQDRDGLWAWQKGVAETTNPFSYIGLPLQSAPVIAQQYIDERFDGTNLKEAIDYNFLLNINSDLKNNKGNGVAIALLDSAINKNISFRNQVIRPFGVNFPNDNHASFLAGIIAGKSNILGIADKVTLIELPIFDENGDMRFDEIDNIFKFVNSFPGPLILNVSQNFPPIIQHFFEQHFKNIKNAILVASAGLDKLTENDDLNFPSSLSRAISVGSLSRDFISSNDKVSFNKKLDFILPAFDYTSYSDNETKFESGLDTSSVSTAIISSVIALLISQGTAITLEKIKEAIIGFSKSYGDKTLFNFLNIITPE